LPGHADHRRQKRNQKKLHLVKRERDCKSGCRKKRSKPIYVTSKKQEKGDIEEIERNEKRKR
jgi:hypothetical protein